MNLTIARDVTEIRKWSVNAKPGDVVQYHIGNLGMDIATLGLKPRENQAKLAEMTTMREFVFGMYKSGLVHPLQRMLTIGRVRGFQYLAFRSRMGRLPR